MRKYVLIDATEVPNIDFTEVLETSAESLRYSLDGNKVLLKFEGNTPDLLFGLPEYTYEEITPILTSLEWHIDE